jgi:hypothetical protein
VSRWCAECESTVGRLLEIIEALMAGRNIEGNAMDVDGAVCATCKLGVDALVGEIGALLAWGQERGAEKGRYAGSVPPCQVSS